MRTGNGPIAGCCMPVWGQEAVGSSPSVPCCGQGLGLVFVAVYQKALSLLYVDVLLERIKQEFAAAFRPDVYRYASFDDTFKRVLKECELRADQFRKPENGHPVSAQVGRPGVEIEPKHS